MYQLVEKCEVLGRSFFFALLGGFFTYFCVEKHISLQIFLELIDMTLDSFLFLSDMIF